MAHHGDSPVQPIHIHDTITIPIPKTQSSPAQIHPQDPSPMFQFQVKQQEKPVDQCMRSSTGAHD